MFKEQRAGLAKLSNGPYGVVTSLLVLARTSLA